MLGAQVEIISGLIFVGDVFNWLLVLGERVSGLGQGFFLVFFWRVFFFVWLVLGWSLFVSF